MSLLFTDYDEHTMMEGHCNPIHSIMKHMDFLQGLYHPGMFVPFSQGVSLMVTKIQR